MSEENNSGIELGKFIEYENVLDDIGNRTSISLVAKQVKNDKEIHKLIQEILTFTPAQVKSLGSTESNVYLMMIPKALIYYQDAVNMANDKYDYYNYKFDDMIVGPSYLLSKEDFPKGTTNVSEKMRLAKMQQLYPKEYGEIVKELRKWKSITTKLEGHIKHLQTLNDNLKKIRESIIVSNRHQE